MSELLRAHVLISLQRGIDIFAVNTDADSHEHVLGALHNGLGNGVTEQIAAL